MTGPDWRTPVRWTALAGLVVGALVVTGLSIFNERLGAINLGREALWWWQVIAALLFFVPGVVVLLRSNWHPVGWLLVNLGFGFLFSFGPDSVTVTGLSTVERWWLWLTGTSQSAAFWTVWSALILVFPDRLRSRRGWHRRIGWGVLGFDAVCVVATAFRTTLAPMVEGGNIPSPMPLAAVPAGVATTAALLPNVVLLVAIVDFVARYRRARDPVRSQYRWVVWGFLYTLAAIVLAIAVSGVTGDPNNPVWALVIIGYLLVPASFMVAILRYRLYDIDRIVSRTVAYALVALTVAGAYAVPVLLLPRLLGESTDLVVAASTLAAAAAFNPARRRIQRGVDHRFNRARFDAERELDMFSARLGAGVTLDAVREVTGDVLGRTLEPASIGLWTRTPT